VKCLVKISKLKFWRDLNKIEINSKTNSNCTIPINSKQFKATMNVKRENPIKSGGAIQSSGGGGRIPQASVSSLESALTRSPKILYENEIAAAKEVLHFCLETDIKWFVLLAQMQSGKTMTYYFITAEMIRLGRVEKGVIFSGSAEKELKKQVENSKAEFFKKYEKYLVNEEIMSASDAEWMCDCTDTEDEACFANKIKVVWSGDLKRYEENPMNTFFVWEESHYAQNQGMRPGHFLKKIGVCPTGDPEHLNQIGSYLLSVSATPFSEISDQIHLNQHKRVIRMIPGRAYYGVEDMISGNKIRTFKKWEECLPVALEAHKCDTPKWVIIRGEKGDRIKEIAEEHGYEVLDYNSKAKELDLRSLQRPPKVNTVILLKGMLRMGKRLHKKHISFMMETSRSSGADVVLQGLIGRGCGYDANPDTVFYVHESVVESEYLEDYVNYMVYGKEILPRKAKNIVSVGTARSDLYEIIPIKLGVWACELSRDEIISAVRTSFQHGEYDNYNTNEQLTEISRQVMGFTNQQFKIAHVKRDNTTYDEVPSKIRSSIDNRTPMKLGSGCGINAAGTELGIFVFDEDYNRLGISRGDVYLDARTEYGSAEQNMQKRIAKTNKKEVFCRSIDDLEAAQQPAPAPTHSYAYASASSRSSASASASASASDAAESEPEPASQQALTNHIHNFQLTTTSVTTFQVIRNRRRIQVKKIGSKTKAKLVLIDDA